MQSQGLCQVLQRELVCKRGAAATKVTSSCKHGCAWCILPKMCFGYRRGAWGWGEGLSEHTCALDGVERWVTPSSSHASCLQNPL